MLESRRRYIPYAIARDLIEEADLLLYRNHSMYSWFIKKGTRGEYSHIGLASWHNGNDKSKSILETIEFYGWSGGGVTSRLSNLFPKYSGDIDIYRPAHSLEKIIFLDSIRQWNTIKILRNSKAITNTMRELTGLPYGWRRIWWFIKSYMFGLRLCYSLEDLTDDQVKDIIYPICSTAISYSFSKNGFDLLHERADEWTSPSDFATSPLTNYLFTLI